MCNNIKAITFELYYVERRWEVYDRSGILFFGSDKVSCYLLVRIFNENYKKQETSVYYLHFYDFNGDINEMS